LGIGFPSSSTSKQFLVILTFGSLIIHAKQLSRFCKNNDIFKFSIGSKEDKNTNPRGSEFRILLNFLPENFNKFINC
jgi:hypothetical protein